MSKIIRIGNYGKSNSNLRRMIYDINGVSPCIMSAAGMGGGFIPAIKIQFPQKKIKTKFEKQEKMSGKKKNEQKVKVGSDFSGVGAFDYAIKRVSMLKGFDVETIYTCDWDKYARISYAAAHGEPPYFPKDVYEREIPKDSLDIYMTSPPCQAFSLAGKRAGKDDSKGRGILFFNSLEFIQKNKPRFFIFENVKGLLSDDSGKTFQEWVNYLGGKSVNGLPILFPETDSVPYHLYWQVLNTKNHGVPQNRERVFLIGIRDDEDNNFSFPKEEHLVKRLKDVLEIEVDKKYFLSEKMISGFMNHNDVHNEKGTGFIFKPKEGADIANALRANAAICPTDNTIKIGFINQDTQASTVFSDKDVSPTLSAGTHGYALGYVNTFVSKEVRTDEAKKQRKQTGTNNFRGKEIEFREQDFMNTITTGLTNDHLILEKEIKVGLINHNHKDSIVNKPFTMAPIVEYQLTGGKWDKTHEQSGRVYDKNGIAPTIHTMGGGNQEPKIFAPEVFQLNQSKESNGQQPYQQNRVYDSKGISPALTSEQTWGGNAVTVPNDYKIRRLTPLECFRLQDFPDIHVELCKNAGISDSQLYKQAGNSITVRVLEKIILKLKL